MSDGPSLLRPVVFAMGILSLAGVFALACGPDKQESPPPFDGRSPNPTGGTSDDDVPAGDDTTGDDDDTSGGDDTPIKSDSGSGTPDATVKDASAG